MKKIFNYMAGVLFAALAMTACSPEEFAGADGNIPSVSDYENAIDIQVDQTTNQVTFTLNAKGCMPYWYFRDESVAKAYSTVNGLTKIYTLAGDYTVDVRLMNRNGVSDGVITKTFHIDNTIFDFSKYITMLTGDSSKEWRINSAVQGHLGCGEPGTDGLNWWSAAPNDKADWGVYDDVLTFIADKKYTYNPGEGGTVYVNTGCSIFGDFNTNDGNDFMAQVEEQNTTFDFVVEGTDLYIVFPSKTLFPYIANDDIYNTPRYKIQSITPKAMELVIDNGSIAWHYTLTSEKDESFNGFKYNSEFNLWKDAEKGAPVFWYAPGWAQIADPEYTTDGNAYTLTLPEATTDTWMAQMSILTDIATNAATNYDFSVVLNVSKDHPGVMVKLVQDGDDATYYCEEKIALKAYEDVVFWKSDMPGIDMTAVKLVLDFGGNEAGTEVTVKNIVLKDHANDDGTVLPNVSEEDAVPQPDWVATDSEDNIWNGLTKGEPTFWYAPGWAQIDNPEMTTDGKSWTLKFPEATTDRWQNQFAIPTDMAATMDEAFDFKVTINSTAAFTAFVKLTQADEGDTKHDDNYFFAEDVALAEYDDVTFWVSNVKLPKNDAHAINLVLDFGGNPAGAEVVVKDIVIQKHVGE